MNVFDNILYYLIWMRLKRKHCVNNIVLNATRKRKSIDNQTRLEHGVWLFCFVFCFFRTWTEFTTLVGHGKLFGLVALQRRALGFRIDLVALDQPVQTNATQTRFQIHRVAVLEQYVAFGPARFCEQRSFLNYHNDLSDKRVLTRTLTSLATFARFPYGERAIDRRTSDRRTLHAASLRKSKTNRVAVNFLSVRVAIRHGRIGFVVSHARFTLTIHAQVSHSRCHTDPSAFITVLLFRSSNCTQGLRHSQVSSSAILVSAASSCNDGQTRFFFFSCRLTVVRFRTAFGSRVFF